MYVRRCIEVKSQRELKNHFIRLFRMTHEYRMIKSINFITVYLAVEIHVYMYLHVHTQVYTCSAVNGYFFHMVHYKLYSI